MVKFPLGENTNFAGPETLFCSKEHRERLQRRQKLGGLDQNVPS